MNIIDALEWRYATKKFDTDKKLPAEKIDLLKKAFNLTATSYGLQPVKLLVIANQELKERLVEHTWNQKQVADASHVLVFAVESNIDAEYITAYFNRVKAIRDTPDEILNPFREYLETSVQGLEPEERKNWLSKQAYIAMGNLLTVCALEQIDACPMEGFDPEAYNRELGLEQKGLRSVLVMPVGYRAEDDMFADLKKVRKEVAESVMEL